MGLNCIWTLWNPDVLWRAWSGLPTHLFLLQHLKEGGLQPEKTHWWDFSVNTTSQHREAADSHAKASDTNALISLESLFSLLSVLELQVTFSKYFDWWGCKQLSSFWGRKPNIACWTNKEEEGFLPWPAASWQESVRGTYTGITDEKDQHKCSSAYKLARFEGLQLISDVRDVLLMTEAGACPGPCGQGQGRVVPSSEGNSAGNFHVSAKETTKVIKGD